MNNLDLQVHNPHFSKIKKHAMSIDAGITFHNTDYIILNTVNTGVQVSYCHKFLQDICVTCHR